MRSSVEDATNGVSPDGLSALPERYCGRGCRYWGNPAKEMNDEWEPFPILLTHRVALSASLAGSGMRNRIWRLQVNALGGWWCVRDHGGRDASGGIM